MGGKTGKIEVEDRVVGFIGRQLHVGGGHEQQQLLQDLIYWIGSLVACIASVLCCISFLSPWPSLRH